MARCIKIFIHYVGYLGISHPSVSWGFSFSSGCPNLSRQKLVKYRTLPTTCRKQVKKYCYLSGKKKDDIRYCKTMINCFTNLFLDDKITRNNNQLPSEGVTSWCVSKISITQFPRSWSFSCWITTVRGTPSRLKEQKFVNNSSISHFFASFCSKILRKLSLFLYLLFPFPCLPIGEKLHTNLEKFHTEKVGTPMSPHLDSTMVNWHFCVHIVLSTQKHTFYWAIFKK